ncbi:hypothetical protein EAD96_30160 [Micromonospora sp. BL1]|uniref:hypothetical protein n=1 Tax=Micromonospora sp. BL1 TaxID=2478709 RepID=UPI000EF5CCC9|nr:hypothetical protein [Micromonospora sp. BL1]RLP97220.1 hypothetical protein EAD96_30160 [Micromonospora sp. BL1]
MPHPRTSRPVAAVAGAIAAVLAVSPAPAAPLAEPAVTGNTWNADLTVVDSDDVNVRWSGAGLRLAGAASRPAAQRRQAAEGMLVTAPHPLAVPANRVRADIAATTGRGGAVEVAARGWRSGAWTEWRSVSGEAVFDQPVTRVQIRVALTAERPSAAPTVRGVRLVADSVAAVTAATPGLTYRVYATREGLVGGTTANGHVIVSRDHFVALPSARGLAPKNTGDYTVRVCTTTRSRCEYAPVWDIGPWNTRDDYWNPSSTREMWKDLPQGRPEAQAAYQSGYNGGRDQFGRTVGSPAGIDLADGTFWDGLLLTDNAWVDVAYLWTGTGTRGRIGSGPLNIRSGPGTSNPVVGLAATYANVPIECSVVGQSVSGPYRTTTQWNRLASGHFISHAYVSGVTGTIVPC